MTSQQTIEIIAQKEDQGLRADLFLTRALQAQFLAEMSRARVAALIKSGHVQRRGQPLTHASAKITAGDSFTITLPPIAPSQIEPRAIKLDVIYEDDDLIVVNKPAGMPVHPARGHHDDTLVNALLHHCQGSLSGIGGQERPGIVHRLDMNTSGLIVAAKTDLAHHKLAQQFAAHGQDGKLTREYLALVWGWPPPGPAEIDAKIGRHPINRHKMAVRRFGGKPAITHYQLRERFGSPDDETASLLACRLLTGRTHQIRVHLSSRDWPLIGDPLYRRRKYQNHTSSKTILQKIQRQALHAAHLGFVHPRHKQPLRFDSPPPADFQAVISLLKSQSSVLDS